MNSPLRQSRRFATFAMVILAALVSCLSSQYAFAQSYTITNLGSLGGGSTYANDINAAGQVVGESDTTGGVQHGFVWQQGVMTDLGNLGTFNEATQINASGQVVGFALISQSTGYNGFLWQNGVMSPFEIQGISTVATGINDLGHIVCNTMMSNVSNQAYLMKGGVITNLGVLPGFTDGSYADAINNSDQIIGWCQATGYVDGAFIWQKGVMTALGTLGGNYSAAYQINNSGQVIGYSNTAGGAYHAFLWQNGVMKDLGTLGGMSIPDKINAGGGVVGFSKTTAGTQEAVLWQNGTITDLNTLIPPGSNWVLSEATSITDAGQITGTGKFQGQTASFLLTPVPAAKPRTVSIILGTTTAFAVTGTDYQIPPLPLTYAIASSPAHGTINSLNSTTGVVSYSPNPGFNGTDSFTFTASDSIAMGSPATVTLNVQPGVPTAKAQTDTVVLGNPTPISLAGSDPDKPPITLTYTVASSPLDGTLGGLNSSTGQVTYTPNSGFKGTDSFTFTVTNGTNTSAAAKVTLNVAAGTPTATPQSVAITHSTAKTITLTGTDPDVPTLPLTFALVTSPIHGILGSLNAVTGAVKYTPTAAFSGADSFTFTVSNGTNKSTAATVTLNVAAGVPTSKAQTVAVSHNTAAPVTLTGTDPDTPALPLTYAVVAAPTYGTLGTLNKATGTVTYTPKSNYQGTDTFTYTVSNGTNTSSAATITLKVAPGTPKANAQSVTVPLSTRVTITLTGTDPDEPALKLTYAIATQPAHGILGSLNTSTGVLVYTPDSGYKGTDSFTFTVSNGVNKSAAATITLNVGGG